MNSFFSLAVDSIYEQLSQVGRRVRAGVAAAVVVSVLAGVPVQAQIEPPSSHRKDAENPEKQVPSPSSSLGASPSAQANQAARDDKSDKEVSQGNPESIHERGEKFRKFAKKYDIGKLGERGIGEGMNFYSLEKEQMMGRELAGQVEQQAKLIKDPIINEYINRVGQNLVRNSDAKVPFTIKVVDDEEINAFALPGGFFYVNSGLILAAENEAELAGVMAHEIAHVAARHATKNATKGEIWNLASIPLIFVGGPIGMAVRQVAGLAVPMTFLKFSRGAEREADLLGLQYQYATGYDPQAFVSFFEKLQAKKKNKSNFLAKAFASHPMTEDRIERSQAAIEQLLPDQPQYIVTTSEFEEVKARLAQLTNTGKRLQEAIASDRPTLRRKTSRKKDGDKQQDDDDVPVLRRKD